MRRRCSPSLLVLCAAATATVLGGCGASALISGRFDPPQVSIGAARVDTLSLAAATLSIGLDVFNPNPYSLRVRGLEYRLSTAGTLLAEGAASGAIDLPGEQRATVILPVRLDLEALARAAQAALSLGEVPYDLELRFNVGTMFLERPVRHVESSVLRLTLPLGLARRSHMDASWQQPAG